MTVHPRAGGEHKNPTLRPDRCTSPVHPRAGGEHRRDELCSTSSRYTVHPRAGGEHVAVWLQGQVLACRPVHPRAGGEHAVTAILDRHARFTGSSPRGRGTRVSFRSSPDIFQSGSSPRGRGTLASCLRIASSPHIGSSPRGRGTLHFRFVHVDLPRVRRFIPARAGNTPTTEAPSDALQEDGSSPRGRGTHVVGPSSSASTSDRFIPARAGNTCNRA